MKRFLVWIVLVVMTLTMFTTTGFAKEAASFKNTAPVLKSVSSDAFGIVTVKWEGVKGAEEYGVLRKAAGESSWKRISATEKTSYANYTAELNRKYVYTVRAYQDNKAVSSKYDTKGLTVTPKRGVLSLTSVKNVGLETIKLTWKKQAGDVKYYISRKEKGGAWKQIKTISNADTWTDTTVKSGKTYSYRICAKKTVGGKTYSTATDSVGKTITCNNKIAVKLGKVTNGFNAATVTWSELPGANKYYVYRKTGSGSWEYITSTKKTSYTDTALSNGKTYAYTIRGVKKTADDTIFSLRDSNGIKVKAGVPKTVQMKSAKMVHFRTAEIKWDPVEGADGYFIYRRTKNGSFKFLKNVTGISYMDMTPEMDTKYYYTVQAYRIYNGKKTWTGRDKTGVSVTLKSTIDPNKPMIALTYDDGPGKYTGQILSVLDKYDAHATFFVVGRNVANNSAALKRAYNLGCEIGNHSYTHPSLTSLGNSELASQVNRTDNAVKKVIGVAPALLRPPYGAQNERVRSRVNKSFIMWSVDTRDWEHRSVSKNIASVKANAKDGAVILMHDIHKSTADAAESIVSYLTKKGYQLVTVSELAYYKGYKLKNGKSYSRFY